MSSIIILSGPGGTVWTEDDGATWHDCTGITSQAAKIVHANGMWMAAATDGTVWISSDGKAWTQVLDTHALGNQFKDLAFGGGAWIAAGKLSYITTNNGATWTELTGVPSPLTTWNLGAESVTYGSASWIIGGGNTSGTQPPLVRSVDGGTSWTPITPPGDPFEDIEALAATPGMIVAWGSPYTTGSSVTYSTDDGASWIRAAGTSLEEMRQGRLAAHDGTFLFAGNATGRSNPATTKPEAFSTDGATWPLLNVGWSNPFFHDACFDGVRWVITGYADHGTFDSRTPAIFSVDKITWTGLLTWPTSLSDSRAVGAVSIPPPPTQVVAGVAGRRVKRLGPIR